MTELQITTIKCAYADLVGAYQAYKSLDIHSHEWNAHLQSISEMERDFDFIEPIRNNQSQGMALHVTCSCGEKHNEYEQLWVAFMKGYPVRNQEGSLELFHTYEEALLNSCGDEQPLRVNQTTLDIQNELKRKIITHNITQHNT